MNRDELLERIKRLVEDEPGWTLQRLGDNDYYVVNPQGTGIFVVRVYTAG